MHVHIIFIEMPLILLVLYGTEIRFEGQMPRSRSNVKVKYEMEK